MCAASGLRLEESVHFDYTLPLLHEVSGGLNVRFAEFMERCGAGILGKLLASDYIGRYRNVL